MMKQGRPNKEEQEQISLKKQLFADAYAHGVTYTGIAQALGLHKRTLMKFRAQLGLPARGPGNRTPRRRKAQTNE